MRLLTDQELLLVAGGDPIPTDAQMDSDFDIFQAKATAALMGGGGGPEPYTINDARDWLFNSATGKYFLGLPQDSQAAKDFWKYVDDVTLIPLPDPYDHATQDRSTLHKDAGDARNPPPPSGGGGGGDGGGDGGYGGGDGGGDGGDGGGGYSGGGDPWVDVTEPWPPS